MTCSFPEFCREGSFSALNSRRLFVNNHCLTVFIEFCMISHFCDKYTLEYAHFMFSNTIRPHSSNFDADLSCHPFLHCVMTSNRNSGDSNSNSIDWRYVKTYIFLSLFYFQAPIGLRCMRRYVSTCFWSSEDPAGTFGPKGLRSTSGPGRERMRSGFYIQTTQFDTRATFELC